MEDFLNLCSFQVSYNNQFLIAGKYFAETVDSFALEDVKNFIAKISLV